jgi:F-type H+-transporting ATPase subunit epsilon
MVDSFKFELVSPERLLASLDIHSVILPGSEGEMTIMANHAPVMTSVKPGVVVVNEESGKEDRFVIFGGFADITPESCTLLAESAVNVNELDRADLEQRIRNAREDVEDAKDDESRTSASEYLDQLTTLHNAL